MNAQPDLPIIDPATLDIECPFHDLHRVIQEHQGEGYKAVALTVDRKQARYLITFAKTKPASL